MCLRDLQSKTTSPQDFLFYLACYPISGEAAECKVDIDIVMIHIHQIWAGVSSQARSSAHLLHHLDCDQGVHHHLGRHWGDHHHFPQQAHHNKLCQDYNNGEIDDSIVIFVFV